MKKCMAVLMFLTVLFSVFAVLYWVFATSAMAKEVCPSNCTCEVREDGATTTTIKDCFFAPSASTKPTTVNITNNVPPVPVNLTVTTPTPPAPTATTPPAPAPAATPAPAPATPACNSGTCGQTTPNGTKSSGPCGSGWCQWLKWLGVAALALILFFWIRSQRQALAIRRGEAAAARELYIRYNGINPAAPETLAALRRTHQADGEMRAVQWYRPLRSAATRNLPAPTYEPDPAPPAPAPPAPPAP